MKKYLLIILILSMNVLSIHSQNNDVSIESHGFIFGIGLGVGPLSLSNDNTNYTTTFSSSLPNIKFGYMINEHLALYALLPGSTYKYEERDRGFEGVLLNVQYWLKEKWWIGGGAGMTFDAPAFYTVKDPSKADFFTGFPAFSLGAGYEIWQKGKFALDIQYRAFYGKSKLDDGTRQGIANVFIIGFNWY